MRHTRSARALWFAAGLMTCVVAASCAGDTLEQASQLPLPLPVQTVDVNPFIAPTVVDETIQTSELMRAASFRLAPSAANSDDGILQRLPDLTGQTLRIDGPTSDLQADSFTTAIELLEAATGVSVEIAEAGSDGNALLEDLAAGNPPDLAVVPQPAVVQDFARKGELVPMPASVVDLLRSGFDPFWSDLVQYRGLVYAVPNRANVKSLVWYDPQAFERNNYEVPQTWAELESLMVQMLSAGQTPWCVGISSGEASGWPLTDWIEDILLRLHGPDVYDQWTRHEIGFDDPRVLSAVEFVGDIWFGEGHVLGGRSNIALTHFWDAGLPLLDGDCMMHRQASFYAGAFAGAGAAVGPDGDVDVFYLPTISDEFGSVVLGAGNYIAGFTDRPATYAALTFFASSDYANARIATSEGGFLSPNRLSDVDLYPNPLDRRLAEILVTADPFRFDASDLMPATIGAGEFWSTGTSYVSGAITAQDFLDRVEANWPR